MTGKLGIREAQQRAMREARFQRQPAAKPAVTNVTNVTNGVTNTPSIAAANDKARVARWRAKNPEHYRTYMREFMQRLRAERRKAAA